MLHLKNNPDIKFHEFPITPFVGAYDLDEKIAPYLTIGELFKATKLYDKNDLYKYGIPIHKNATAVHTYLRKKLNKALFVGSAYRSYEWDVAKGRSGDGQHPKATAIDLNGIGLVNLIETALNEKNEVYKELRRLGVNGFGIYDWGIHLDFRASKPNGDIYKWDDRKKKVDSILIYVFTILGIAFLSKKFKSVSLSKRRKKFKKRY